MVEVHYVWGIFLTTVCAGLILQTIYEFSLANSISSSSFYGKSELSVVIVLIICLSANSKADFAMIVEFACPFPLFPDVEL